MCVYACVCVCGTDNIHLVGGSGESWSGSAHAIPFLVLVLTPSVAFALLRLTRNDAWMCGYVDMWMCGGRAHNKTMQVAAARHTSSTQKHTKKYTNSTLRVCSSRTFQFSSANVLQTHVSLSIKYLHMPSTRTPTDHALDATRDIHLLACKRLKAAVLPRPARNDRLKQVSC